MVKMPKFKNRTTLLEAGLKQVYAYLRKINRYLHPGFGADKRIFK